MKTKILALTILSAGLAGCQKNQAPDDEPQTQDQAAATTAGEQDEAAGASEDIADEAADPQQELTMPERIALANEGSAAITSMTSAMLGAIIGAEDSPENLLVSPWSIELALGMTALGAEGPTRNEMLTTLGFSEDEMDAAHQQLAVLTELLLERAGEDITLRAANRIYAADDLREAVSPTFQASSERYYDATLTTAPFRTDAEGARETINAWVSEQTEEKIPELLASGTVDASTSMVLVNAVYFLASWLNEFDPENTASEPFTTIDGEQQDVMMMNARLEGLAASTTQDYSAVTFPYAGRQFGMTVVLPNEGSFEAVQNGLSNGDILSGLQENARRREVIVKLPRFTFRWSSSLVSTLQAMGMTTPFSGAADFSSMFTEGTHAISDVIHEAFIEVDEEGTEAAAATAVVVARTSAQVNPNPPLRFYVDRPFFFVLHDLDTKTPLFVGRVMLPASN